LSVGKQMEKVSNCKLGTEHDAPDDANFVRNNHYYCFKRISLGCCSVKKTSRALNNEK